MRPGVDRDASIFLVGFMGAGKTAVGRALARRLGREFADTDELVEATAGCPIETIFRDRGEGRFREMEWDVLRELATRRSVVVATGGGLFLGTAQRNVVRESGVSIWLDVGLESAERRVGDGASRPVWSRADALERRAMFERRRAVYALADASVDADAESVETVVERVESRWRSLFR